jgi:hypothetical protein
MPGSGPDELIETAAAAPNVRRDQREFARLGVSSHGEGCRSDGGSIGGKRRISVEPMNGDRGRDARLAMLLPAVQVQQLSTRSGLSKSVPCNIIVVAGARPAADYLKPKVVLVEPSTRVMALSEKMSLHIISQGVPRF